MKVFVLILLSAAVVGLAVRQYLLLQKPTIDQAHQVLQTKSGLDNLRKNMQGSAEEAGENVPGKPGGKGAPKPAATPTASAAAATAAERGEIEAALKAMHLTTIMPGQPGLVIIDKQEYSEGEDLPLSKGRKARIVSVQDDGVQLACNGMTYHLAAPAAPDLAALRQKK